MFAESILTSKGQLTLPKIIRDKLQLKAGDKVIFIARKNKIEIEPAKGNILDWYGSIKAKKTCDLKKVRTKVRRHISQEVVREGKSR